MYYAYQKKLYTKEQIEGMTFSEEDKPEPLFTLEEMKDCYDVAYLDGEEYYHGYNAKEYFKDNFDITL